MLKSFLTIGSLGRALSVQHKDLKAQMEMFSHWIHDIILQKYYIIDHIKFRSHLSVILIVLIFCVHQYF